MLALIYLPPSTPRVFRVCLCVCPLMFALLQPEQMHEKLYSFSHNFPEERLREIFPRIILTCSELFYE
jgi:hypothetical protein